MSPSVIRARTSCPDLAAYRDRYAAEYARHGIFIPSNRPQTRPLGTRVYLKIELADGGLGYSGAASVIEHVREGARVGYLLHLDEQLAGAGEPGRVSTDRAAPPAGAAPARATPPAGTAPVRATPPAAARTPRPAAPSPRTPAPGATPAPAHVIGRVTLTPAPRRVDAPGPALAPEGAAASAPGDAAPSATASASAEATTEPPSTAPAARPSVLDTLFGAEGPGPARTAAPPPRDPFGEEDAPPPDPFSPTPAPIPRQEPAVAPAPPAPVTPPPDAPSADAFVAAGAARLSEADLFADGGAPAEPVAADRGADPTPTPTLSLERTDGASLTSPLRLPRPPLRVRLARHKVAVAATLVALGGVVVAAAVAQRRTAAVEAAFFSEITRVDERVQAGRLAAPVGDAALDHLEAARRLLAEDPRLTSREKALADTFESLGRRAFARGDLQEAAAHFRSALRADPARASARAQLETIARTAPRHRGAAP